MLKIENLTKSYRLTKANIVDALRGVSFEVAEAEVMAIIGPSGSGKSTLLNIMGGLDRDYKGKIHLGGKELREFNPNYYRRYVVATIFQQFYLIPSLTVEENVALPGVFSKKFKRKELKERVDYLLKEVGLETRKFHKPKELSGGQAQRVAIARALLADPAIVLADEPTGNLDSKTGGEIIDLLYKINTDEQTTVMIVTHDLDIIDEIQHKVFLKDGVIEKLEA
jgi:putative ABC transport system ATP-binding protein